MKAMQVNKADQARRLMSLGKRYWGAGFDPPLPLLSEKKEAVHLACTYTRAISGQGTAKGPGPDRSLADSFWCMMAAQRGWSIKETASKLLEVSAKAQERARLHDEGYALITAQNAAAAAERGKQRARDKEKGCRLQAASLTAPHLNCTVQVIEMESPWPPPQLRARMAR
jgi:hypothetical protein